MMRLRLKSQIPVLGALTTLLLSVCGVASAFKGNTITAQEISSPSQPQMPQQARNTSLKIKLRLQNETIFDGAASVRVMPEEGYEILGDPDDTPGEFLYSGMAPGKYFVEVSAPGYLGVRLGLEISAGESEKTFSVIMKPRPTSKTNFNTRSEAAAKSSATALGDFWNPHDLEQTVYQADAQSACPQEQVLQSVGQRMKEFVSTLEKFTAVENLEHYAVNQEGERKAPEIRRFNYVVMVTQNREGTFLLEEFRNGSADPEQFPGSVASVGLPAINLIFHPMLVSDFDVRCEGLGQWKGHKAWQVHFAQRTDKPVRIRIYHVGNNEYPVLLEGRAWIDPVSFQVMRLESQLQAPIPQIGLKLEHLMIDYLPVRFHSSGQEIWLPKVAELYVDRQKKRYFRRHTFSDFELFNVDEIQKIQSELGSYIITNLSDREVAVELTVKPAAGTQGQTANLRFTVPARGKVTKVVGLGKDVNLVPDGVGSAAFTYNGDSGQVTVESSLVSGTITDVKAAGQPR
jgi:hypothetical protein